MLRLTAPKGALRPEQKIIRAADYAQMVEAETLVAEARREAEAIREKARAAFEEEKKRGYEEGLAEGQRSAAEVVTAASVKVIEYLASVEGSVSRVVMMALERILGQIDERELILRIVRTALEAEYDQRRVTICVHPTKVPVVNEHLDELRRQFPGIEMFKVSGDAKLSEQGCVLCSDLGTIDASLETQLAAIRKALDKTFPHLARDPAAPDGKAGGG